MESSSFQDILKRINEFPCHFKLVSSVRTTVRRLRVVQHSVLADTDTGRTEMEQIRNQNLLTWIYFCLGKHEEAIEMNNDVVKFTKMKNIASLGNCFFIMWKMKNEKGARKCLKYLEKMKREVNYRILLTEAYCYGRLGGHANLKLAIKLYSEAVTEIPDNYLWKFGLGLVYRRATHENIVSSSPEATDVEEYKQKAAEYLFEVVNNGDDSLQAKAYAELVNLGLKHRTGSNPKYDDLFRDVSVEQLCRIALSKGYHIHSVLTQCGKLIRKTDVDESIRLLRMSLDLKKTSTNCHYLGISYKVKSLKTSIFPISECVGKNVLLTKDDQFIKEAIKYFELAISIATDNFQAVLDLGILLRGTSQIRKALSQINRVTSSHFSSTNHTETVIRAYEQAGLCYIELGNHEKGNIKLTTAVSLAADLVIIMPDYEKNAHKIWKLFRMMLNNADRKIPASNKLLELTKAYGRKIEVFQQLRRYTDSELNNPSTIENILKSYIEVRQPEYALAFQNIIAVKLDVIDPSWWTTSYMRDLKVKVLLETICGRLKDSSETNPTVLFQRLFKLFYGACFGLRAQATDQINSAGEMVGDVLVVYDGDYDSDAVPSSAMKSARCFKKVATNLFGLEAEENLKGCGDFSHLLLDRKQSQLQEMGKYNVVIIIVGNENRNEKFDALLTDLSCSEELRNLTRILVVDAGLIDGQVPGSLKQYNRFKLENIGGLGDINQCSGGGDEGDQLQVVDIINHLFNDEKCSKVDAIMKLFCFLIGQQWPFSEKLDELP